MEKITVRFILEKYRQYVDTNSISFIKDQSDKTYINEKVNKLIKLFQDAEIAKEENKQSKVGKSLSDFIEAHKVHSIGRELWERLCSLSLNLIDPSSKGNSILFEYLEEATKFEDILYGLEMYYRDHTLHSLWVYFIGEYIMRGTLKNLIDKDFNWYLYNDIKKDQEKYNYPTELLNHSINTTYNEIITQVNEFRDAIWCIIALCHDLGYSLEKLAILNSKVENVLKFYSISNQNNIGYFLDIEHQFLVSQFLELMAMDVRIVPSEEYREFFEAKAKKLNKLESEFQNLTVIYKKDEQNREVRKNITEIKRRIRQLKKFTNEDKNRIDELVLTKCYRDDSTFWRLCQSLENKKHGILSSYLLFKVLGLFAESTVMGPAEEWGLSTDEAKENLINGNILFAIAQHTFNFAHLDELNSLCDILIFVDEIEEFSRFGRQLQSRKYYDTTANVTMNFRPRMPKKGNKIHIQVEYAVEDHLEKKDYFHFFWRKAEQLCKIYSLGEGNIETGFCKIGSIKIVVKSNNGFGDLYFIYSEEKKLTKAKLPKPVNEEYKKKGYTAKTYQMECLDDRLYIILPKDRISLKNWLNIKD